MSGDTRRRAHAAQERRRRQRRAGRRHDRAALGGAERRRRAGRCCCTPARTSARRPARRLHAAAAAAENGNAAMIEALLEGGADANSADHQRHDAADARRGVGQGRRGAALLDHGADVERQGERNGETALMFAAADGRADASRVLTRTAPTSRRRRRSSISRRSRKARAGAFRAPSAAGRRSGRGRAAARGRPRGGAAAAPQVAGVNAAVSLQRAGRHAGRPHPLLFAARQGYCDAVQALLEAAPTSISAAPATRPRRCSSRRSTATSISRSTLLEQGANPKRASENGVDAALRRAQRASGRRKALYPQPRAYEQQQTTYLDLMKALLDKGADPNARLTQQGLVLAYNFDLSGVDETGATPFWRAAYAGDVDGDEAARRVRRRSEHPDDAAAGPRRGPATSPREVAGRVAAAAGSAGRPRR